MVAANTHLDPFNEKAVNATLARFNIDLVDMINHIDSSITEDSIALGAEWYRNAFVFACELDQRYDLRAGQAAAVIAALSPRMGWDRNKRIAESVIADWKAGKDVKYIKGALSANIRMAVAILNGSPVSVILTGVKRRSFYNNIVTGGTSDDVTVDTWMQRVVMAVSPDQGMDLDESNAFLKARNHSGYVAIAHAVRVVAKWRDLSPSAVQAAYWIVASGSVHGKMASHLDANTY